MYLPQHLIDRLANDDAFQRAVEAKLSETSTYADSDVDIVDGALSDVIQAVLETL